MILDSDDDPRPAHQWLLASLGDWDPAAAASCMHWRMHSDNICSFAMLQLSFSFRHEVHAWYPPEADSAS
jgi:hypothetical protein